MSRGRAPQPAAARRPAFVEDHIEENRRSCDAAEKWLGERRHGDAAPPDPVAGKPYPQPIEAIRQRLSAWLSEDVPGNNRTLQVVGRGIGMSPPVLSQFVSRTYKGSIGAVARKLEDFFAREDRRALHPPDPAYRENRFTKMVLTGLRHAQDSCDIAIIYGDPGKGKTLTIQEYVRNNPTAILLTCNPTTRSDRAVLEDLVALLRQRARADSARALFGVLLLTLRGSRRLLIVDEAQHMTAGAVNILRALHDETGIGIVLCGNEEVWQRMETGKGIVRAPFAQLRDRVGFRRHLKGTFSRKEVEEVAAQIVPRLDREGVDYLHAQAERTGSLRIVTKHCTLLAKRLNGTGRAATAEDLRAVTGLVA